MRITKDEGVSSEAAMRLEIEGALAFVETMTEGPLERRRQASHLLRQIQGLMNGNAVPVARAYAMTQQVLTALVNDLAAAEANQRHTLVA